MKAIKLYTSRKMLLGCVKCSPLTSMASPSRLYASSSLTHTHDEQTQHNHIPNEQKTPENTSTTSIYSKDEDLWDKWEFGSFPIYENNPKANSADTKGWFVQHNQPKPPSSSQSSHLKVAKYNPNSNPNRRKKIPVVEKKKVVEEEERWKADPLWTFLNDADIHQCNQLLLPFITTERKEIFSNILNARTDKIRFVFECPSNPNNVWAALRTFDAFGIQFIDVILPPLNTTSSAAVTDSKTTSTLSASEEEAYTPYITEFRKGSMNTALGSQKWLTIEEHTDTVSCLQKLKDQGYIILASDLHQASLELPKIQWQNLKQKDSSVVGEGTGQQEAKQADSKEQKFAFVMGNEAIGISNDARKLADYLYYIPMKGFAESLNLSVACAVTCTTLANTGLANANLDEATKNRLLFVWLLRTVRGAMTILKRNNITALESQPNAVFNRIGNISTKP